MDEGAAEAITREHGSLLARGIQKVEGKFKKDDIVDLMDLQNRVIARGISQFDNKTLQQIQGKNSKDILFEMPGIKRTEVIHRDGMILLTS